MLSAEPPTLEEQGVLPALGPAHLMVHVAWKETQSKRLMGRRPGKSVQDPHGVGPRAELSSRTADQRA